MDFVSVHEALAEIFATCEEIDSEVAGIKQEVLLLERLINAQAPLRKFVSSTKPGSMGTAEKVASSSSDDNVGSSEASDPMESEQKS